jgi:hemerythrin-like metal-binding protein
MTAIPDIVEWDDRLSTGVADIDQQHRTLIDMINGLYRRMQDKAEPISAATFAELRDYIHTHFEAEYALMNRYAYPDLHQHEFEHVTFTRTVDNLYEQMEKGEIPLNEGLVVFLVDWFVDHVSGTDVKMGAYIKEHAGGAGPGGGARP